MWVHGSKSQAHLNINNALSESIMFLLLYANAGKLCVVCETGRWYSSSLWPCHAVTVSGVESPSILLPWACLWVEAVPARHQIKPPPHLLYFTVVFFCHVFTFHLSPPFLPLSPSLSLPVCLSPCLPQTVAEGLMLASVAAWVFVYKDESPPDADSFAQ